MKLVFFLAFAFSLSANASSSGRHLSQSEGSQGSQGLLSGIDLSALPWDSSRLEDAMTQFNGWIDEVRQTAEETLTQFPLVNELINSQSGQSTPLTNVVETLGVSTDDRPIWNGLQGEGIFATGFLEGLTSNASSLFSGQPLDGSTITYIQNAIDAAGGSGTQVGQFLQSLFSQAAGVEQGNLFQSITSQLSGGRGGIFSQAVQRVRDANGGILPSLDGSFVEQVMKLINNGLGGGR